MWAVIGWFLIILLVVLLLIGFIPVGVLLQYRFGVAEIHFTLWKKTFVLYPVVEKKEKPAKKSVQKKKQKSPKKSKSTKTKKMDSSQKPRQSEGEKPQEIPEAKVEKDAVKAHSALKDDSIKLKTKKPEKGNDLGLDGQIDMAKGFIPVVLLLFQRLGQYKKIDRLELDLLVGSPDPVEATMLYGKAHALLGTIWLPLDHALNIQKGRAGVRLGFDEPQINLNAELAVSMTIGQICYLLGSVGLRAYKIWKTGGEKDG